MKRLDLTGQVYGRLTVLEYSHTNQNKDIIWRCLCQCGQETRVSTDGLRGGRTHSCGCLRKDSTKQLFRKYGNDPVTGVCLSRSRAYGSWTNMHHRCYKPNDKNYKSYGGRGIKVCPEWTDFMQFVADMGDRPIGMSIDRIDPNGNYEPANCQWASTTTQGRNRRVKSNISIDGQTVTVIELSEILGIPNDILHSKLRNFFIKKSHRKNIGT